MIFAVLTEKRVLSVLLVCSVAIVCALAGCATDPSKYKTEADEKVYGIIEQKWTDDLPSPVNYRISDVTPGPNDIQIERVVPPDGILTLPQAVAIATAHNRQYQLEKELLYISALDLVLARHVFEPQFFGFASGGYARATGEDISGIETGFESERVAQELIERRVDPEDLLNRPTGTGMGFNQLLHTGALFAAEVAIGYVHITGGDLAGGSLASILRMNVAQPLLRGSDRVVVMENLTQAERNTLYQLRTFNRFRQTFVVSIINQYYTVMLQQDFVNNARLNHETLAGLYEKTQKLVKAGRVPKEELDRIRQEKLNGWDILIQTEKIYKQQLDEFKIAMALPATVEFQLDDREFAVLRNAGLIKPEFSETEAINTALGLRLDLANKADFIIDAYRKIAVAADGFKAGLNITTQADIPLQSITPDAKIFADNFEAFLELDLPLDRELEQNLYRKALITFNMRRRDYEDTRDLIMLQVRQAYRDLIEAAERYRIQLESTELAQKRLKDTYLLLQYGRASSRRVLNAQDDLYDAQNAATEALVNYTIATLNFYRDTGVLQVRPDGMWSSDQVAGEPIAQDESPITHKMPDSQNEQITPDIQESLEQPVTQIEPEPVEQPAQITPIDAEEYISQWMKKGRQGN